MERCVRAHTLRLQNRRRKFFFDFVVFKMDFLFLHQSLHFEKIDLFVCVVYSLLKNVTFQVHPASGKCHQTGLVIINRENEKNPFQFLVFFKRLLFIRLYIYTYLCVCVLGFFFICIKMSIWLYLIFAIKGCVQMQFHFRKIKV